MPKLLDLFCGGLAPQYILWYTQSIWSQVANTVAQQYQGVVTNDSALSGVSNEHGCVYRRNELVEPAGRYFPSSEGVTTIGTIAPVLVLRSPTKRTLFVGVSLTLKLWSNIIRTALQSIQAYGWRSIVKSDKRRLYYLAGGV